MLDSGPSSLPAPVRPVAFYLPQFHPTPENDAFWGKGFTEWRKVVEARPRFRDHRQPHLPADLGFYDLRVPEVRLAQAELASAYGLHGFCYCHYWFSGRRVLNRPFDEVMASSAPDFPFMLCWANENWTRAWDGGESEVLLSQTYSDADTKAHARHLLRAFCDPRYIQVDGRPAFAVYNVDSLPDPRAWSDLFRETCQREGIDPYLIRVEKYLDRDRSTPKRLGFDAALEFQPFSRNFLTWQKHRPELKRNLLRRASQRARNEIGRRISLDTHHDLAAFVDFDLSQPAPDYPWFPGVCPSWDNSARRPPGKAIIFRNSSPDLFARWMGEKCRAFRPTGDANLLFVNAWNEWAEGNHLEPCQRYGHDWLEALLAGYCAAMEPTADIARNIDLR